MSNLLHAHRELYKRSPDEQFGSVESLFTHCEAQRNVSRDVWRPPQDVRPQTREDSLILNAGADGDLSLNDWSFSQLCRLALVSKETVNRVAPDTASRILIDTMPTGSKPLQLMVTNDTLRSIHGVAYSRLWNSQLLDVIRETGGEFIPPPPARNGGTLRSGGGLSGSRPSGFSPCARTISCGTRWKSWNLSGNTREISRSRSVRSDA